MSIAEKTPLLSPLAKKRWQRFNSLKRGYYSAVILVTLLVLSGAAELISNHRALVVKYDGEWFFPVYSQQISGKTFGLDYSYEANYKDLKKQFEREGSDNWVLMPPVPFGPLEIDVIEGDFPPHAPSSELKHYLGTDTSGRDVLSRMIYGFRVSIIFSLLLLLTNYTIGITLGCIMGFWGGWFDLLFQRVIEIWSNVPVLYVLIIVGSVITPSIGVLVILLSIFGWTGMTWYMRTATYKESARDYVMAAKAMGASPARIIFKHILPNTVSTIDTFVPFAVAGGITTLTALDFLGYGLPAPTPSWGELLKQGTDNLESSWIVLSVVGGMTFILMLVAYIGEAIRDAYDPRKFAYYE